MRTAHLPFIIMMKTYLEITVLHYAYQLLTSNLYVYLNIIAVFKMATSNYIHIQLYSVLTNYTITNNSNNNKNVKVQQK